MGRGATLRRMGAAWADALYPPSCLVCQSALGDARALCVDCWSDTHLIGGTVCDGCGAPVQAVLSDGAIRCDFCEAGGIAWNRGRAAAIYGGGARAMILALKHGDRPDIARTAAKWMVRAGADILAQTDVLVPVPLHWRRFLSRRYNQAAEISRHLARISSQHHAPDMLRRVRPTEMQHASAHIRRANVRNAFQVPRHMRKAVAGARLTLVDDVLTTGATLNAATHALLSAGAENVNVLVFARVVQAERQEY